MFSCNAWKVFQNIYQPWKLLSSESENHLIICYNKQIKQFQENYRNACIWWPEHSRPSKIQISAIVLKIAKNQM